MSSRTFLHRVCEMPSRLEEVDLLGCPLTFTLKSRLEQERRESTRGAIGKRRLASEPPSAD